MGLAVRPLKQITWIIFMAGGLGLLAYGVIGLYHWQHATHQGGGSTVTPRPVAAQTDRPSETPVGDAYSVAADLPKTITLPTIDAKGFVQQVDVTVSNAMGVPDNIFMAGWYNRSVKPGDKGLSIIDGHVRGQYRPAVFTHLGELRAGDEFTITFGDNTVRRFTVKSVNSYTEADAQKPLFAKDAAIEQQLNLITCVGEYDTARDTYDRRTVVVAELTQ